MSDSYQSISCLNHERKIQWFVKQVISNIFLNNKRKLSTDCLNWYYKLLQKKDRKIIIKLRKGTSIFLKIFIRFDYFINKKTNKKTNISFRIWFTHYFCYAPYTFSNHFLKKNWPSFSLKNMQHIRPCNSEGLIQAKKSRACWYDGGNRWHRYPCNV